MQVVLNEVLSESAQGEVVELPVARGELWKRRWRGVAEDGTRVEVDLAEPTRDGEILGGKGRCFRVKQQAEEVVVIPMPESAEMAAKIGWYLGNRHLPVEVRATEIVVEMIPRLTDSLARIGIPCEVQTDVLRCRTNSSPHRH